MRTAKVSMMVSVESVSTKVEPVTLSALMASSKWSRISGTVGRLTAPSVGDQSTRVGEVASALTFQVVEAVASSPETSTAVAVTVMASLGARSVGITKLRESVSPATDTGSTEKGAVTARLRVATPVRSVADASTVTVWFSWTMSPKG